MGAGVYHSDVRVAREAVGSTRSSEHAFDYSQRASAGKVKGVHPDLNIFKRIRECRDSAEHPDTTPIAVAMDVTSSRGRDARVIYEQVPSFLGSLVVSDVVPHPQILWAAIGDATHDKAPIQIGQFESDRRIDEQLAKIWMEEGGGGTGEESYELLAYALARKTDLDATRRGKKGFVFFTGDEAPYPAVSRDFVKSIIGDDLDSNITSEEIFRELSAKFHPFLIFPRSSMEDRRVAIDSEIRQRLERLGGRFKDVSIRASLIWDNRNDLDLHCVTPSEEHIYYGSKRAACGGELDVDRNVTGEDPKPVENIRWAKGTARKGWYIFYVELYRYHEPRHEAVPFKVETDVDGVIKTFEGSIKANRMHQEGRVEVARFFYDPESAGISKTDVHDPYKDEVILAKWGRYIPAAHILRIQDPASAVEVMLGVMALQTGKMSLDQFAHNMAERRVPRDRQQDAHEALKTFAMQGIFTQVPANVF